MLSDLTRHLKLVLLFDNRMTQVKDATPFIIRRRNIVKVMIFLELFFFSTLKDFQLFQRAYNTLGLSNSYPWGFVATQLCGGLLAMKFGGHQVKLLQLK